MMMEDRYFFPAALEALKPQDWTEIALAVTGHKDPLFSDVTEERFDGLRAHILFCGWGKRLKPNEDVDLPSGS
jgi:hypothetical protein